MPLSDYLSEETICLDLQCQQRDAAIRALLREAVEADLMAAGLLEDAMDAILERESLGSTAIGRGVAVPHARLEELQQIVVEFGYSAEGIDFSALDGEPVHQVFLIVAPLGRPDEYLNVMERITRLVQNEDFRRFVPQVEGRQQILDLIQEMDH